MPRGLLRFAVVVELLVCLAVPAALLLAGAVMLPILAISLPSDMADSANPREPLFVVLRLVIGVAGGCVGLYAVFGLARRVLSERPVPFSRRTMSAMLCALVAALVTAYFVTGGPSSTRAGLLLLALPGACIAHLLYLTRYFWVAPEQASGPPSARPAPRHDRRS